MSSTERVPSLWIAAIGVFGAAIWAGPALGQSCPGTHAACDNGGCCLSSEQCCPTLAEGCCSSFTPYCCGDGTCAAAPSQCGQPGAASCEGYDVPCGSGCAPAGADCCDAAGHYCPPESMCVSELLCVTGDQPSAASVVSTPVAPVAPRSEDRVLSPIVDPEGATSRSCAFGGGSRSSEPAQLAPLLLGLAIWLGRRRGPGRP